MKDADYETLVRELETALVTPAMRKKLHLLIANASSFENPAQAFARAERICAEAYDKQRLPDGDDPSEAREQEREAREGRNASWFERLYCQIRDMADDFHKESIRRRDGLERGAYSEQYLVPSAAVEGVLQLVYERVSDWDY